MKRLMRMLMKLFNHGYNPNAEELYLAGSFDAHDLEIRTREWDRRRP